MKSKPNIYLSFGSGILFLLFSFGGLVLFSILFGQLNVYFVGGWFVFWGGIPIGLQIHIVRKLKWFEDQDQKDEREDE